jgi:hypothetical protein
MRRALAALVATLMISAGCSDKGPSVPYPDNPGTPSGSATTPPARLHWKVADPVIADYLGLYTQDDADQVWNLAVDLVKKWHLNPRLLQARRYKRREFRPLARLMTEKPAKQWRKDVRLGLRGLDLGGEDIDYIALRNLFALVVFNLPPPKDGNWKTPMVTKPTIEGAVFPAIDGLRVSVSVTARFHVDRGTEDPVIPYTTTLQFYYRQPKGEWKLDVYTGKWKLGTEIIPKPKKTPKKKGTSKSPSSSATSGG